MFKVTILFEPFEGMDEFDSYYLETHMPLARKVPGLLKDEVTIFTARHDGESPPYHLMTEMYFESEAAWRAGMDGSEGQALVADAKNFPASTRYGGMLLGGVI